MKIASLPALVLLTVTAAQPLAVQPAAAQQSLTAGICPLGTFAKNGSSRAKNVGNCSARNKSAEARFAKSETPKRQ